MAMRSNSKDQSLINSMSIKGKITKRQRPNSPIVLTTAATASSHSASTSEGGTSTGDNSGRNYSDLLSTSPSHSGTVMVTESTEEEEDMANCLILLAKSTAQTTRKSSSELPTGVADNKPRVYAYQCKTCERCFTSFQALGGHRASHKKSKNNTEDHQKPLVATAACLKEKQDVHHHQLINIENTETCTALSLQISTSSATSVSYINNNINIKSSKVHECLICGAEFSSGQALGGHMRRHRPMPPVAAAGISSHKKSHEGKKPRNLLSLDLNLPAPEDDEHHQDSKFPFSSKQQVIVFSATPLVDCHY